MDRSWGKNGNSLHRGVLKSRTWADSLSADKLRVFNHWELDEKQLRDCWSISRNYINITAQYDCQLQFWTKIVLLILFLLWLLRIVFIYSTERYQYGTKALLSLRTIPCFAGPERITSELKQWFLYYHSDSEYIHCYSADSLGKAFTLLSTFLIFCANHRLMLPWKDLSQHPISEVPALDKSGEIKTIASLHFLLAWHTDLLMWS